MGLFERIFNRKDRSALTAAANGSIFQTLTAYQPAFSTWNGEAYEDALIRAVVDAKARHISKLRISFEGAAKGSLKAATKSGPNVWQSWPQFLYRASTILDMCNNCAIVPVLDQYNEISGYYPVLPDRCEVVEAAGKLYLRYTFASGKRGSIEYDRCAILTKHQFKNDFFGENNRALDPTLSLLDVQRQGLEEGIKNSASFRFMAQLGNFAKPEDLAKERQRFNRENLQGESNGILLFPNTYSNIQQITSKPFSIDADEMKLIQTNVFNYFGCNEKVLQNSAIGDELDAYFNGCIEPFAIQLSDGMTRMTYTAREIGQGNRIDVTANRLQYMSVNSKIQLAQQMGDRGVLTVDEIRDLFNYAPLPNGLGDRVPVRGEYYDANKGKDSNDGNESV